MLWWVALFVRPVSPALQDRITATIDDYPDFPKQGIVFKDIMPLLADPELFRDIIDKFSYSESIMASDAIIGIDARGFLFASAIAYKLGKPLISARKPGKLPGTIKTVGYGLEYGKNELSIQEQSLKNFRNFAIVDDLLATGGTVSAVAEIVQGLGKAITGVNVLVELTSLNGSKKFDSNVFSIVQY